jgi:hypothetical protein
MERNGNFVVWSWIFRKGFLTILLGLTGGELGVSAWAAAEDVALYPNNGWVWRFAPVIGPQSYDGSVRVEGERGTVNAGLDDIADKGHAE